jgi:hypothetical protein
MHDELLNLLNKRSQALVARDKVTLDQILSPNFIYTNAQGQLMDKKGYFSYYVDSGNIVWQLQDVTETQISLYGDTAVVSCLVHDVATYNVLIIDAYFRTTHTIVKLDGRWQIVASHTSPVVAPDS